MHYKLGEVEAIARYIDYCHADQISKVELIAMARELNLKIDGCSILWLDITSNDRGYKEVKTDLDALKMANSVRCSKEMCVCVGLPNGGKPMMRMKRILYMMRTWRTF